jgi:hypothetical protein
MRTLNELDLQNVSGAGCCRSQAAKSESAESKKEQTDRFLFAMPSQYLLGANSDTTKGCCN